MMETAAGGALIGSQVGGPAGALVGAVIGGAIGTVRMFMESDRDHIKKLVKEIYGMDINNPWPTRSWRSPNSPSAGNTM
jgi:hypothetical protein